MIRNYGKMKTTLILRDDLVRRAKSRAALAGIPLSRFMEECLATGLKLRGEDGRSVADWAQDLPQVSPRALQDLNAALESADFRPVEREMWE
jgi:hypothetical protein